MTPADRTQYLQLAAELAGIATRLKMLSDEADEKRQSCPREDTILNLVFGLLAPSEAVAVTSMKVRELAEEVP